MLQGGSGLTAFLFVGLVSEVIAFPPIRLLLVFYQVSTLFDFVT